jgi:glycosyl hydrolase family 38
VLAHVAEGGSEANDTARRPLYVVPFSHLDLFWAGTREECLARGNRILSRAIAVAERRPEYRFLVEDEVFTANFMESHVGSEEAKDFADLVRKGRFEIAPKWAAIFQNLPNGEVLARNVIYGKRYARQTFGVDPQVAHLADIPGYSGQFPQILAKAAVPYMSFEHRGQGHQPGRRHPPSRSSTEELVAPTPWPWAPAPDRASLPPRKRNALAEETRSALSSNYHWRETAGILALRVLTMTRSVAAEPAPAVHFDRGPCRRLSYLAPRVIQAGYPMTRVSRLLLIFQRQLVSISEAQDPHRVKRSNHFLKLCFDVRVPRALFR